MSGPSRRSVVRTAAHAAWAVPAIQIATSAPAFAAASDTLAFTAGSGDWDTSTYPRTVQVMATVRNNSVADTTANLQVTVTFPNLYVWSQALSINLPITIGNVTGGWAASAPTYAGSGTGRTASVTFTAAPQLAAGAAKSLGFRAETLRLVDAATAGGSADTLSLVANATSHVTTSLGIDPSA